MLTSLSPTLGRSAQTWEASLALMWDPSPLVLELHRKSRPRNWMKALPLALRQSVHVQPRQGSGGARAPKLQSLQLMQGLIEPSGEMSLVTGNLLQGLLVRQEALPNHVSKIPLHLLGFELRPFRFEPGVPRGSLQQFFGLFVGGLGDCIYDRTHQPGGPAFVAFPRVTVGKTRHR